MTRIRLPWPRSSRGARRWPSTTRTCSSWPRPKSRSGVAPKRSCAPPATSSRRFWAAWPTGPWCRTQRGTSSTPTTRRPIWPVSIPRPSTSTPWPPTSQPGSTSSTPTGEPLRQTAVTAGHRAGAAAVRQPDAGYPPRPTPHSNLWRVLREGTPLLVRSVPDAMLVRVAEDPEHLRLLRALQLSSLLYVPLQARGRTLGVLGLFTTAVSGRRLSSEALPLVEEIGRRAALAVGNSPLNGQ